jgi:hypothetical protein
MNIKPLKKLAVIGAAAAAVVKATNNRLEAEAIRAAYLLPDYFTVTAHAGCNGTEDNTLESLNEAIESGADIVEVDVLDGNGTILLAHDFEEGREYPTFEEALLFIRSHSDTVKVNVDLKRNHIAYEVDEIIRSAGMADRCFLTGVNIDDAPLVASSVSVPYYINVRPTPVQRFSEEYWLQTAAQVNMLGGTGVNLPFTLISKKGVEICRSQSLLVSLFTPSSQAEIDFSLLLLPDNITTRRPGLIIDKRRVKK